MHKLAWTHTHTHARTHAQSDKICVVARCTNQQPSDELMRFEMRLNLLGIVFGNDGGETGKERQTERQTDVGTVREGEGNKNKVHGQTAKASDGPALELPVVL